jgi:hypothetical protein
MVRGSMLGAKVASRFQMSFHIGLPFNAMWIFHDGKLRKSFGIIESMSNAHKLQSNPSFMAGDAAMRKRLDRV